MAVPLGQTWCCLGKCFEKRAQESQSCACNIEIELKKNSTGSWKCWLLRDFSMGNIVQNCGFEKVVMSKLRAQ